MNKIADEVSGTRYEGVDAHDEIHEETRRRVYAAFLEAEGAPEGPTDWEVDLGPAGAYLKQHGVYERMFEHGVSLANPTDHVECVVLPHMYKDLEGREHTTICLAPHSGDVLVDPDA